MLYCIVLYCIVLYDDDDDDIYICIWYIHTYYIHIYIYMDMYTVYIYIWFKAPSPCHTLPSPCLHDAQNPRPKTARLLTPRGRRRAVCGTQQVAVEAVVVSWGATGIGGLGRWPVRGQKMVCKQAQISGYYLGKLSYFTQYLGTVNSMKWSESYFTDLN